MTKAAGALWHPPATEQQARIELAAAYRMVAELGWTDLGATHLSAAVPGEPGHWLMIEYGLFFDEVTASNLVKLDESGAIVTGRPGATVNPAGVTIHAALHGARPEISSVMHTHTPAGLAVSCHPDGLLPLSQHALRFYDCHGIHTYEGVALDGDEGPRLARDLADGELLILRNHGLLTVGPSVPEAFSALYYAETAAAMQVATLSSAAEPVLPASDVCAHTAKQYQDSTSYVFRDWAGILRTVEARHPDYSN